VLTSDLAIVDYQRGRAIPDRLTRRTHAHYLAYGDRMLDTYRRGVGRTRRELHRAVEAVFADEPDCESRRIRAFAKLLDDASDFETDPRGKAAKLRLAVFSAAAKRHPLVTQPDRLFESGEAEVKADIARELGRPWPEIEAGLYADVLDFQTLKAFAGFPSAEAFLSRYNVAQVQACLYRAERMAVTATRDFQTILRYAKLARLLLEIRRLGPSAYRIELSGPASLLRETRRYGVNLARFLPALLACEGWALEALLRTPWGTKAKLTLTVRDGLRSHLPPPDEFDSTLEESFAAKFGAEREGWRLSREAEIVHEGQTAFVPDFAFRHEDGTEVLFEIVGYWTPEYLERKRETLRRFRGHRVLLAVSARSLQEGTRLPEDIIVYKTVIRPEAVLDALERIRAKRALRPEDRGRD
jgi:predicted nuclease of restriction endonuclease-like RecB superfamily